MWPFVIPFVIVCAALAALMIAADVQAALAARKRR
jgi:hypothetical protein